ncbi:multidrug DMT transporter permease [Burkholderia pyrrocinia]|uniref:Multidrug DMT transporter permease n=1 Tax=Burkholderia pyrrocinia TaxID=60550 RepID=A0A2Z5N2C5_BURPY|nr:MFS transporter [Burkholderia pyrrocinia]AXF23084.1 multidrug DMT transporter permease [Burkholderia pyrrocinia]
MQATAAMGDPLAPAPAVSRAYAWSVFALTFGLLLADYMSRQVLNAVFPLLKTQWLLTDTQLGSLSSIVALMVGLLTLPLSMLADRWGRVRSLILMAILWSLATLGCAVSANYGQMFAARFFVGVGEAAYGSVGLAVVLSVFPAHLRATLSGSFLAGGSFGSMLGMALSGIVAARFGWRWSFVTMAVFGLVLAAIYRAVVTEQRLAPDRPVAPRRAGRATQARFTPRSFGRALFAAKAVVFAYLGCGVQLILPGALFAWLPSYLVRSYGMPLDRASVVAASLVLTSGVGMSVCGVLTDRISRHRPARKWTMAIVYCASTFVAFGTAFHLPPGLPQLVSIGVGMFLVSGVCGPTGALVADLTPPAIHATAMAIWALANNLIGLAAGPLITGMLADRLGLHVALQLIPFAALGSALLFVLGKRRYAGDLARGVASTREG